MTELLLCRGWRGFSAFITAPKLARRCAVVVLEYPVEMANVMKAHLDCDAADAHLRGYEEIHRPGQSVSDEILVQRFARIQLDLAVEIVWMIAKDVPQGFVGDAVAKVFMDVVDDGIHLGGRPPALRCGYRESSAYGYEDV